MTEHEALQQIAAIAAAALTPPTGDTPEQIVVHVYAEVGRAADPEGLAYWANRYRLEGDAALAALRDALRPTVHPPIPVNPGGPIWADLSDTAIHHFPAVSGQAYSFSFHCTGGYVDIAVITISGSSAKSIVDSGPGFTDRQAQVVGSSLFHKGVEATLAAGTYTYTVALNGVVGAEFGVLAMGAVG